MCGCPYELPIPQDMTAYSGLAAVRKALLVEVLLPWWITPFRYVEPVPLKYFIQKEAKINKVIDIKGLTDCLNEHRSVLLYYRAGMTDQTG